MNDHPRRPLVVVDWNFLQSLSFSDLPPSRLRAPPSWDFLLPGTLTHEVLEKESKQAGSARPHLFKLMAFCREYRDRFWIAKANGALTERSYGHVRLVDLVEVHATLALREQLFIDLSDPDARIRFYRGHTDHSDYLKCEREFVEFTANVRMVLRMEWAGRNPPQLTNEEITKWIRDPASVKHWMPADRMEGRNFTDAQLRQFPDMLPLARWVRLHVWYHFQRSKMDPGSAKDLAFSNCFADFEAAFLASYTGYLITGDKGQQKAARAICPDVEIWDWDCAKRRLKRVSSP